MSAIKDDMEGITSSCDQPKTVCPAEDEDCVKTYTVYFVRHGEAIHNVLEKQAQAQAKESAMAEGYAPDSNETLGRIENARKEILNDTQLQDCPLTDLGKEEAESAKQTIAEICEKKNLPAPTQVLVSPLQRALQTAATVFPECHDIHVREELRERQTGKACDTRMTSAITSRRNTFSRFSFTRLKNLSGRKFDDDEQSYRITHSLKNENDTHSEIRKELDKQDVEEKHVLRERTHLLFKLLSEKDDPAVAVVAHKGYLRELERGPLGNENAKQFDNCEVRVYRISVNTDAPIKDMVCMAEQIV